jgi:hypothetical protein
VGAGWNTHSVAQTRGAGKDVEDVRVSFDIYIFSLSSMGTKGHLSPQDEYDSQNMQI